MGTGLNFFDLVTYQLGPPDNPAVLDSSPLNSTKMTRAGHSGLRFAGKGKMLFPLSDAVWGMFFRGIVYGFLAGIVLTILFLWSGKYGALAGVKPIGFVYFLAGLEIGIALIGAIVFLGLHAWHDWGHRMTDQSKRGGAS